MIKILIGESIKDIEEKVNFCIRTGYTLVDSLQVIKRRYGKGPKCGSGVSYTEIDYEYIQVMKKA